MSDPCVVCGQRSHHTHHRNRNRADNSPANLLRVCFVCHDWIHRNTGAAYALGLLVHSWDSPASVPVAANGAPRSATQEPMQTTVDGDEVPHTHVVDERGVEKVCPKCHGDGKIIVKPKVEKKERAESSPIYNARTPKGQSREILEDDEDHLTDLLVKAEVLKGHEGARWWVIHYCYRFALQNARAFITEFKGVGS